MLRALGERLHVMIGLKYIGINREVGPTCLTVVRCLMEGLSAGEPTASIPFHCGNDSAPKRGWLVPCNYRAVSVAAEVLLGPAPGEGGFTERNQALLAPLSQRLLHTVLVPRNYSATKQRPLAC